MLDGRRPARVADASARLAAGTTLALTASEAVRQGFRVAADLTAHPWAHAGATRLAQWEPGVPAAALPPDINRRVNAALTAAGRKRRPPRRNRQSESRPMPAASRGNWGNCVWASARLTTCSARNGCAPLSPVNCRPSSTTVSGSCAATA